MLQACVGVRARARLCVCVCVCVCVCGWVGVCLISLTTSSVFSFITHATRLSRAHLGGCAHQQTRFDNTRRRLRLAPQWLQRPVRRCRVNNQVNAALPFFASCFLHHKLCSDILTKALQHATSGIESLVTFAAACFLSSFCLLIFGITGCSELLKVARRKTPLSDLRLSACWLTLRTRSKEHENSKWRVFLSVSLASFHTHAPFPPGPPSHAPWPMDGRQAPGTRRRRAGRASQLPALPAASDDAEAAFELIMQIVVAARGTSVAAIPAATTQVSDAIHRLLGTSAAAARGGPGVGVITAQSEV